jgi:predicted esterase
MKTTTRNALENAGIAGYSNGTALALATVRELNNAQHMLDSADLTHGFRMVDFRAEIDNIRVAIRDARTVRAMAIVAAIPVP